MNRDDEAVTEFRRAEDRAKWRAAPAIALGVLEMSRGREGRARREFARARALLDARPESGLLLTLRHNEAVLLAQKESGLGAARRLWHENIEAGYLPSRFSLAKSLTFWAMRGRRPDAALAAEAAAAWEAIAAETPDHTGARLAWADLLVRTGRRDRAALVLEDGLARRPGDPSLLRALREATGE
jgi:Flp pilus assembly protein TadD